MSPSYNTGASNLMADKDEEFRRACEIARSRTAAADESDVDDESGPSSDVHSGLESNQANATNTTRNLGVRFDDRTKVRLIPSISDYTDEEFTATWMVDEDTATVQAGLLEDIRATRTAGAGAGAGAGTGLGATGSTKTIVIEESHCFRGLEAMRSTSDMEQRKIARDLVIDAVLDAQDAQFELSQANVTINEEELLEASTRNSRGAREEAESLAASDEAYVRCHVRPEVDEFMRAFTDYGRDSAVDQTGDHLSVLKTALQVLDSEDQNSPLSQQHKNKKGEDGLRQVITRLRKLNLEKEEEFRRASKIAQAREADDADASGFHVSSDIEMKNNQAGGANNNTKTVLLAQCADEGIPTNEALSASHQFEQLEEYWWNKGHEKEAEAAAAASAIKKGDPNYSNDRQVRGDCNNSNKAGTGVGPTKITLPKSMADQAEEIQKNLKSDTIKLLQKAGGDSTNPRFLSAVKVLSSIYKGRGYDARRCSITSTGCDDAGSAAAGGPCVDGSWTLLSKPMYPDCLGTNDEGDFIYTLARMSFGMFSPGAVKCSIQSIEHQITVAKVEEEGVPEAVPRKLRDLMKEVENGAETSPVLRNYDITVNLTIEPQEEESSHGGGVLPSSSIRATMTTFAFLLPDPKVENRFSVWFTGGKLCPVDCAPASASSEWQDIFGQQSSFGKRTLRERANVIAAKFILGAELPDKMEKDGSMRYIFHRPPSGHLDVLYHDDSFRVLSGNRGSIMVQKKKIGGLQVRIEDKTSSPKESTSPTSDPSFRAKSRATMA